MAEHGRIFTAEDKQRALSAFSYAGERPLDRALRFQAALKALLMDARRSQRDGRSLNVFAVDPVEIVSMLDPSRLDFAAFTFRELLDDPSDQPTTQTLKELDRLVSLKLLGDTGTPFLLLDSYCDELIEVRQSKYQDLLRHERLVISHAELADNPFSGFSTEQIIRIRENILNRRSQSETKAELNLFFNSFLPHWRADLFSALERRKGRVDSFDRFLSNANYVFLRGDHFGERRLSRLLPGFDWSRFTSFLGHEVIVKEAIEIRDVIHDLASRVAKPGRTEASLSRAAMHDAQAIADLHVLNSFLEQEDDERRVELVTRSAILPNLLRALPSGIIKVQLRHPLLLPEAFHFGLPAVEAIADISQRFDAVITPYLERRAIRDESTLEHTKGDQDKDREYFDQASAIAKELVKWLADSSMIQAGTQIDDVTFKRAYISTLPKGRIIAEGEDTDRLIREIRSLFDLIVRHLGDSTIPLTRSALIKLIEQNKALAETVWSRAFAENSKFRIRALKISDVSGVSPIACVAFRSIESHQTRLFHLHSTNVQKMVGELGLNGLERMSPQEPLEIPLSSSETIKSFGSLLDKLYERSAEGTEPSPDEMVHMIDVTLLVGVALASRGEESASLSLVSTVLHYLMTDLRSGVKLKDKNLGPKLSLAWQELLLFRQYAERRSGIQELLRQDRHATTTYIRGSLERNFARAQRDLDLAAELGWVNEIDSSSRKVNDIRLRLVHMSGWLEMFLMTCRLDVISTHDRMARPLVRLGIRKDIWSAVGYTKESLDDIQQVRSISHFLKSKDAQHIEAKRYLAHIEARLLQNAIVSLVALLFSRRTPMAARLLDPTLDLHPEQLLKYDHWAVWWGDLCTLVEKHNFKFRLIDVIDPVARMLVHVERLRGSDVTDESGNRLSDFQRLEAAASVWRETLQAITSSRESRGSFGKLLTDHIAQGLQHEIDRFSLVSSERH